ncbi:hypothetical protein GCM10011452_09640 [Gemmobacter lanyuensis]|uniref:Uncharacterized protein n=1 Tax=Gemmobacter lanyuensis TaxID=1054497 RepID=A0A918INQ9_9RHOB|nr:hypothetical protein [Gemmobacter lanyuensis]GGW24213.1 hypothetical protein GCM10011452_09640 [Gemmobacter lanyuensis]
MFKEFLTREDGAITVDFVVVTGLVAGLSIGVTLMLNEEVRAFAVAIAQQITG